MPETVTGTGVLPPGPLGVPVLPEGNSDDTVGCGCGRRLQRRARRWTGRWVRSRSARTNSHQAETPKQNQRNDDRRDIAPHDFPSSLAESSRLLVHVSGAGTGWRQRLRESGAGPNVGDDHAR